MPLSIEYTKNLLKRIATLEEMSKNEADVLLKTSLQEKFYLTKLLLPEFEHALLSIVNKGSLGESYNIISALCNSLSSFESASYDDFFYFFKKSSSVILYNFILLNKNVPIEFWIEDKYYERLKGDSLFGAIRAFRIDIIYAKRRNEAAEYLREKLRSVEKSVDSLNDEMVFKVSGVSL